MSDTCRAWARFPGLGRVLCDSGRSTPYQSHDVHGAERGRITDDEEQWWKVEVVWTDDAPGLETGYEEEP